MLGGHFLGLIEKGILNVLVRLIIRIDIYAVDVLLDSFFHGKSYIFIKVVHFVLSEALALIRVEVILLQVFSILD